jgi:glucuronate isomerase
VRPLGDLSRNARPALVRRQVGETFGVRVRPSIDTADQIYDQIASCIASPEFKPRALYQKFGNEVLATTDDPCDDLVAHQFLASDETRQGRVHSDLPAGQVPRGRSADPGMPMLTGWPRCPGSTPVTTTDISPRWGTAASTSSAVSSDHSHFDARTDALEVGRPSASILRLAKVRFLGWRRPCCVAISCRRWPGWHVMTAW